MCASLSSNPFFVKAVRETADGRKDPNAEAKDKDEARLVRLLKVNLNHHRERILEHLGDPPNLAMLDDAQFWNEEQREVIRVLRPELERMALAGAETATRILPVGVEWGLVAQDAAEWAGRYSYDLVRGLNDTTRATLRTKVRSWIDTPGLTVGDLRRELRPLFGETRAQSISVTETTRAFAEGERAVANRVRAEGLDLTAIWNTAGDDRVCPICGPNDRKPQDKWEGVEWPPAHPRCRCWPTHRWERARPSPELAPVSGLRYMPDADLVERLRAHNLSQLDTIAGQFDMTPEEARRKAQAEIDKIMAEQNISIRRGLRGSRSIIGEGRFKTQFETGSSGGFFAPEVRETAERIGLGYTGKIAPSDRPVYGYVPTGSTAPAAYGAVEWRLKPDALHRATITLGDSLAQFEAGSLVGTPALNPRAEGWDGLLRDLLMEGIFDNPYSSYVEAQVQGGVTLDDVGGVTFHRDAIVPDVINEPNLGVNALRDGYKQMAQELGRRGIQINVDSAA
jgi:hypothetical protein